MLIREYTPADLDALRRMHASQGFDYAFPNLDDPIFISKLILEDDTGRPVMAALARLTCEMYLLIDRTADATSSHVAQVFRPEASSAPPEQELSPPKSQAASEAESRLSDRSATDAAPDNASFRTECPAPSPLREAPGHAADAASNACHSERSPAPFSSRGVSAARDAAEESLLDASPGNTPTPGSCGVRELAPAVCRPGSPGSAPRSDSQSTPTQASQNASRAPNSHESPREGNARERWTQLLALHRAGEQDLLARGLDDAHAWLPPAIAKRFGRRLESLGWLRDNTWTPYCRRLKP